MPDIPAEAVEKIRALFACRCNPWWIERGLHNPVCEGLRGDKVLGIFAAALPRLHERWLAEVDGALRDEGPARDWFQTSCPGKGWWPTWAADYLREVFGAHLLDEASVINPATGQPWPRWAGDVPQDPDPRCVCGAPWIEDQCGRNELPDARVPATGDHGNIVVKPVPAGTGGRVEVPAFILNRATRVDGDRARLILTPEICDALAALGWTAPNASSNQHPHPDGGDHDG